jgi:hypothetical protein
MDSKLIIDAECEALYSVLNIGLTFALCFIDTKNTVSTVLSTRFFVVWGKIICDNFTFVVIIGVALDFVLF